ncbi:hypothetical protein ACFV1B_14715 [Streptomyces sp. NPDC059637]|uniref:hypothetical protein n=1 Tax=Streptomyces sp. NPDC059637 TaxID=3347752 RepID=UPI0036BA79B3
MDVPSGGNQALGGLGQIVGAFEENQVGRLLQSLFSMPCLIVVDNRAPVCQEGVGGVNGLFEAACRCQ